MIGKASRVLWRMTTPMRLIVHIGLHKTASTFLQHVLNNNADVLGSRGLYYQKQHGYPAHHALAWKILQGEHEPLVRLIDEARRAKCNTVLLSSEDLEGLLFDDRPLDAIKRAAKEAHVRRVEYHVVLREPGKAFSSLFRELAKHTFADPLSMFYSAMRNGSIHMVEPGGGVPYWYYSFDHQRDLDRLSDRVLNPIYAHEFKDADPFPGWRMIADHLDTIGELPGIASRNASLDNEATIELFQDHLKKVGVTHDVSLANLDDYADAISRKYSASHNAALQQFSSDHSDP